MSGRPVRTEWAPPAASVRAGAARRDITPPVGIYARNWGAARHDVAEGVHRPLYATALAMQPVGGGEPLVLVSLDTGWWQRPEDEWHIRGAVLDALRLDPARLMIACTHTHAGPSTCREDVDKPGGRLIAPYLDAMRDAVVAVAREAVAQAAPATITWATGRCSLAQRRDLPEPGGSRIVCGFVPDERAEDTVVVGRVTGADGRVRATIVNYACHATTLAWDNRLISPDYVGAMRESVEQRTGGAPCLFLQGAAGELAPREQYTGDVAIADANGRQLGYAVLAAIESMLPPRTALAYAGVVESGAPLAVWERRPVEPSTCVEARRVDVELPLKPLPSEAELEREFAACADRTMAERLRRKLRVVRQVGSGPTCRMPLWLWRVGDSVWLGQPNEAYSELQTRLRSRFASRALFVMNLVNGACGYLYPAALRDRDVYQVWQSPFERDALTRLAEACEREVDALLGGGQGGA